MRWPWPTGLGRSSNTTTESSHVFYHTDRYIRRQAVRIRAYVAESSPSGTSIIVSEMRQASVLQGSISSMPALRPVDGHPPRRGPGPPLMGETRAVRLPSHLNGRRARVVFFVVVLITPARSEPGAICWVFWLLRLLWHRRTDVRLLVSSFLFSEVSFLLAPRR